MRQTFSAMLFVCSIAITGCGTAPTAQQSMAIDSGIRVATMAYILNSSDEAGQQARAMQTLATTAQIRAQIETTGKIVPDLTVLAEWVNAQILANPKLAPEDKRLLQAAVLEAIFLAQDTGALAADIGADNAVRVLAGLDQVDRVARTLVGLPG